ncbi:MULTISPECIES: hypothetical protein [Psychrobacter]|nr:MULTISPECIES: hypothetical protein [Psychrobacter]AOY43943.1 hypothetical protein AOT82_1564 [Psychrobacter sp. AntiMn-1]
MLTFFVFGFWFYWELFPAFRLYLPVWAWRWLRFGSSLASRRHPKT